MNRWVVFTICSLFIVDRGNSLLSLPAVPPIYGYILFTLYLLFCVFYLIGVSYTLTGKENRALYLHYSIALSINLIISVLLLYLKCNNYFQINYIIQ